MQELLKRIFKEKLNFHKKRNIENFTKFKILVYEFKKRKISLKTGYFLIIQLKKIKINNPKFYQKFKNK